MSDKFMFTIKANDGAGLLAQVVCMFNRRKIEMISVSAARTNSVKTVLIHVEVKMEIDKTENLRRQINKIVEVFQTEVAALNSCIYQKTVFFKVSKEIMGTNQSKTIAEYGAEIIGLDRGTVTVSKTGNDETLQKLYDGLAGKYLLGFAQSGKIIDSEVMIVDDDERISKLAA